MDMMKRAVIVIACLLVVSGAGPVWASAGAKSGSRHGHARQQGKVAALQAELFMEKGRQELLHGSPAKALVWLNRAYGLSKRPPFRLRFMLARAMELFVRHELRARPLERSELIREIFKPPGTRAVSWQGRIAAGEHASEKIILGRDSLPRTALKGAIRQNRKTAGRDDLSHGHQDTIHTAVYSPDGGKVLTADGTGLILWDAATGRQLRSAVNWAEPVRIDREEYYHRTILPLRKTMAIFSRDGRSVFSVDETGVIRKWDSHTLQKTAEMHNAAFDPEPFKFLKTADGIAHCRADDTEILATYTKDEIALWDVARGEVAAAIEAPVDAGPVFSVDCRLMAIAGKGELALYAVPDLVNRYGRLRQCADSYYKQHRHSGDPWCEAAMKHQVHGAPALLAHLDLDGKRSGLHVRRKDSGTILALTMLDDGRVVTVTGEERINIYDMVAGRLVKTFAGLPALAGSGLAGQFPGRLLCAYGLDRPGAPVPPGEDPDSSIRPQRGPDLLAAGRFSPDGEQIVSAGGDEKPSEITIRDTATHRVLRTIEATGAAIGKALFAASGKYIAAYSRDNTVHVWDAATGKHLYSRKLDKTIDDIFVTGDGRYCLVLEFCRFFGNLPLLVLDLERLEPVSPACGDRFETCHYLAHAPRTSLLASEGTYNRGSTIMVYSLGRPACLSRVCLPTRDGPMAGRTDFLTSNLAFDPGGWLLLAGTDTGTVYLWDLHEDREEPTVILADDSGATTVRWVSFSGDGKRILSLDSGQRIKVWDRQGNRLYTIGDPEIIQADYSPATGLLAVLDNEHGMALYDLASGEKLFSPAMENERPVELRFTGGSKLAAETASGLLRLFDMSGWQPGPGPTDRLVRCFVPFTLKNGRLQPALTDPGSCGSRLRQLLP